MGAMNKAANLELSGDVGMEASDVARWSFCRAINRLANHQEVDGIEGEASRAVAKLVGRASPGFFIPNEIVSGLRERRDLVKGTGNLGGYTVQTDVLARSFIELLRNTTVCLQLGARRLGGLVGDVSIPSQVSGATARWVAENEQTPGSNLTFGQVGLSPHRLSASTVISKMLVAQTSLDVEGLVRSDFALQCGVALDAAALTGPGNAAQPLGILNSPGIGAIDFDGPADWEHIVDFETQVSNANVTPESCAYVTSPTAKGKLKQRPKIAGTPFPIFIWEKSARPGPVDGRYGEINGYGAVSTKNMPDDRMIFGKWSDLIIADWVGMDMTVDPYTFADRFQVKVTINMLVDIALRHLGAFCVSSDSAAQ